MKKPLLAAALSVLVTPAFAATVNEARYQIILGDCEGCHGKDLAGGVALQPGLGIIPTLFGLQQGKRGRACGSAGGERAGRAPASPADAHRSPPQPTAHRSPPPAHAQPNHTPPRPAGQGGYVEPLTPEQQHQAG